jgi:hypothetical protein
MKQDFTVPLTLFVVAFLLCSTRCANKGAAHKNQQGSTEYADRDFDSALNVASAQMHKHALEFDRAMNAVKASRRRKAPELRPAKKEIIRVKSELDFPPPGDTCVYYEYQLYEQ